MTLPSTSRFAVLRTVPFVLCLSVLGSVVALYADDEPKRFGPTEAQTAAIYKVEPVYPQLARGVKTTSRVEIDDYVDTDGSVYSTIIVLGDPKLVDVAEAAAKQWKFTPFQEDGHPIRGIARLVFYMHPPATLSASATRAHSR